MKSVYQILVAMVVWGIIPSTTRAVDLPSGGRLPQVDFERHVMGLLSKAGCNMGSCHGSFQGKNGFRLSLFGFEPALDYAALTRDNLARRIDLQNPDNSLLLQKACGSILHDGGMRFSRDSWQYQVIREWIAQGARWTSGSGRIRSLQVTPADFAVLSTDEPLQLKVTATFSDGTQEDITPFCDFRISDDAIATVSPLGVLTRQQPGDAGLSVLYRGAVQAIRVLVPAPSKPGFHYPQVPQVNFIDEEVQAKLRLLNMVPSDLSSDPEFLRRVYIDTIGILPTPDEVRAFLADQSPTKRERLIDTLLAHPLHAALWATKLSDITGNNTDALENPQNLKSRRSQQWHDWLRKRIAENQPYDQIVRGILTATSRDGQDPKTWIESVAKLDEQLEKSGITDYPNKPTLDLFWRRQQTTPPEIWGEKVAAAFLGVRLECAQCHKHPTDRWTQEDYWGFANIFSPVIAANNRFSSPEAKKAADAENKRRRDSYQGKNNNQLNLVREMFFDSTDRTSNLRPIPGTNTVVQPQALGGPKLPHQSGQDTREKLWQWMRDPANPFFARSFVNRVWAHYFGVGLVNPVDDFSQANPPTNARLLDRLAQEFITSGYDIRRLERQILISRTYQQSSVPNESNAFDKNNFARAYVRPLMAEQVVDVLNSALGTSEDFGGDVPKGSRMTEVGASRLNNSNLSYILRIFGRPLRTTACDCERTMEMALPQTLFRMTDQTLLNKMRTGQRLNQPIFRDKKATPDQLIDELFLACLTRFPTETERAEARKHLEQESDRSAALQDLLWALINTREFILNH